MTEKRTKKESKPVQAAISVRDSGSRMYIHILTRVAIVDLVAFALQVSHVVVSFPIEAADVEAAAVIFCVNSSVRAWTWGKGAKRDGLEVQITLHVLRYLICS